MSSIAWHFTAPQDIVPEAPWQWCEPMADDIGSLIMATNDGDSWFVGILLLIDSRGPARYVVKGPQEGSLAESFMEGRVRRRCARFNPKNIPDDEPLKHPGSRTVPTGIVSPPVTRADFRPEVSEACNASCCAAPESAAPVKRRSYCLEAMDAFEAKVFGSLRPLVIGMKFAEMGLVAVRDEASGSEIERCDAMLARVRQIASAIQGA